MAGNWLLVAVGAAFTAGLPLVVRDWRTTASDRTVVMPERSSLPLVLGFTGGVDLYAAASFFDAESGAAAWLTAIGAWAATSGLLLGITLWAFRWPGTLVPPRLRPPSPDGDGADPWKA